MVKRLFAAILLAAAVLVAPAFADNSVVLDLGYGQLFDPGAAATNTAIDSTSLDTSQCDWIMATLSNTAGATRTLTAVCQDVNGATIFTLPTVSATSAHSAGMLIDPLATTTLNVPSGLTPFAMRPCHRMDFSVAQGGSIATLQVYGHRAR